MQVDLNAFAKYAADPGPEATTPSQPAQAVNQPGQTDVQLRANWVSPTYIGVGEPVTLYQDAMSNKDTSVLVDFEIFDSQGQKIWQTSLDNQSLPAQQLTSFSATFTPPPSLAPGQYLLKTGVFSAGGGTQYASSDSAGSFVIDTSAPTSTAAGD
jgi:hypothetical protein